MCDTMIEVISECLGDEWSPELEVAWTEVLHGISNAIVGNMKKKDNQK